MSRLADQRMDTLPSDALLQTKLYAPAPRSRWVPRPQLLRRLEVGTRGKLCLLSVPPGFGKSSLLAEWIYSREQRVAWLALDAGDNDLRRFLSYLVAALRDVLGADFGHALLTCLQAPQLPTAQALLPILVNEIHDRDEDVVLVLDDYHVIEAPQVHRAVEGLLAGTLPRLHLVLATRADPPLQLSRLRARGGLLELRGEDLRFTPQETEEFLNRTMQLDLTPAEAEALDQRTEGWVAGLQMAALSLAGRDDVATFVESFGGDHRYILDYLTEEVLDRQSEEVRRFLLHTSILEQLCGPLCDAVAERRESQSLLTELDAANLFLIPLDSTRQWYRYHHLFGSLLRAQLETQKSAEVVAELHRRAGAWYADEHPEPGLEHARQAGAVGLTASILERHARDRLMRGEPDTVQGWFDRLPAEWIEQRPRLVLDRALTLFLAFRWQDFEAEVAKARRLVATTADARLAAEMSSLEAMLSNARGTWQTTIDTARRALADLPEEETYLRGIVVLVMAHALVCVGDYPAAQQSFRDGARWNLACGNRLAALVAEFCLGWLEMVYGQLRRSRKTWRKALDILGPGDPSGNPASSLVFAGQAEIQREWGDLDAALDLARTAVRLGRHGMAPGHLQGLLTQSRVHLSRGELAAAAECIGEAESLARGADTKPWLALVEAHQARLDLRRSQRRQSRAGRHDLDSVRQWAAAAGLLDTWDDVSALFLPDHPRDYAHLTAARLLLADDEHEQALALLGSLETQARRCGWNRLLIETLLLEALAWDNLARRDETEADTAIERLREALCLAESESLVCVFSDEAEAIGALLEATLQAFPAAISDDYARRLKSALRADSPAEAPRPSSAQDEPPPRFERRSGQQQSWREIVDLDLDLAYRDDLTGLFNRRLLSRLFEAGWQSLTDVYGEISLIAIDLDRFKEVNDIYGHLSGDGVLQTVAEILSKHFRRNDLILRYGGDELVVLLFGAGSSRATRLAIRAREALNKARLEDESGRPIEVAVSFSMGVACFPEDGDTGEAIFAAADRRLYAEKRQRRGHWW